MKRNVLTPEHRTAITVRLQRQWLQAAALLIFPWLITLACCWPGFGPQPIRGLVLLSGLGLAAYLLAHLHRHLRANHPPGKADLLFPTLGTANWITLLRGAAVVALAGFFPLLFREGGRLDGPLAWAPGVIYLALSLADGLDGLVARRQGRESELGRRLDLATDAAGLLVASLLAVALGRLPGAYLLTGAAYYLFQGGLWWRRLRKLPVSALVPRPYARTIAGLHMGLVGGALLPLFSPRFTSLAGYIFMLPLLAGFLRDWLVVSCRLPTSGQQQTAWDRRAAMAWFGVAPLISRLLLVVAGGMALAGHAFWGADIRWSLALAGCSLAVAAGFAGRGAALAVLLLLGLGNSPFGADPSVLLVFSSSAILTLTGTGPFSPWTPEEALLQRGQGRGPGKEIFDGQGKGLR